MPTNLFVFLRALGGYTLFFSVAILLTTPLATAQTATPAIDQYVQSEMARQHIPGLALGIYRDGQVIKAQGYGLSNVELNVPVKPETIFQSGSVGKQFTATAVMMVVEEGKIGLDDPISKYFPDAPAFWQNIKIKNLLSHTSGLSEYESDDKTKPGGPINLRADYTEDSLVKIIETFPMEFQPGAKWAYRNTNYVLLGMIIHKITGKFYGDFLQERIFRPLGMTSTRIISEADIIPNRSAGYRLVKGELKNQEWVSPFFNTTADGALYFNVLDLAKWDGALYTEKLLKKSSLDQMWTVFKLNNGKPNPENYGFAWFVEQINGHRVIQHAGSWQGFTTYIARYGDDKLTVVVLTNLDSAHSSPGKIAHHVAGLVDARLVPPELKPIEDKEPQVTTFFRTVLEKLAAGKADPDDFAPEFRKEFFPSGPEDAKEELQALGPLQSLLLVERQPDADHRRYTYRGVFRENRLILHLTLDRKGKIAGLRSSEE